MQILVFIETVDGAVVASSWEALGMALSLSSWVTALVIGENVGGVAADAGARGAKTVFVVDDASRAVFDLDLYAADADNVLTQSEADAFLASHTGNGRDLMAAVGCDRHSGVLADCLDLSVGEKAKFVGLRPIYSGNILVDATGTGSVQFATLRPRAADPAEDVGGSADVVNVAPVAIDSRVEVQKVEFSEAGEVSLTDANVIVSGGRGVSNDPERGFRLISELAETLGAAVGASRAAVDAGFIEYKHQVGQTG
mgnify:CR=1 FL=1